MIKKHRTIKIWLPILSILFFSYVFIDDITSIYKHFIDTAFKGPTDLENYFSPINALFSGLAACGAVIVVYIQLLQFRIQQFESVYFKLLDMHTKNRESISVSFDNIKTEKKNIDAFKEAYYVFKDIYYQSTMSTERETYKYSQQINDIIMQQIGQIISEDGTIQKPHNEILEICIDTLNECCNKEFSHYMHHLYHTIKYTYENPYIRKEKEYIRILRSQLSNYELAIIFYDSIFLKENGSAKKDNNFKKLIEKLHLFHNMDTDQLLLSPQDKLLYHESAYDHNIKEKHFLKYFLWISHLPIVLNINYPYPPNH